MLLKTAMQLLLGNLSNNFLDLKRALYEHLNKKIKKELNLADKEKQKVKKSIP